VCAAEVKGAGERVIVIVIVIVIVMLQKSDDDDIRKCSYLRRIEIVQQVLNTNIYMI